MSDDIKVTDGTILEALNGKVDLDGGNYTGSGLEAIVKKNGGGGGLEIGDIGIAPLGIDETKGKRRYLNGQYILQEHFVGFTNKLKNAIAKYPSLACTESEWQTIATMTVGGQVGKFVVDDNSKTIRLPKIIMPIQGLTDLSKLGEIVEAGLPNITGGIGTTSGTNTSAKGIMNSGHCYGAFIGNTQRKKGFGNASDSHTSLIGLTLDASYSSLIYGNSNTVQQEQIQYPYFIQVATGAETEDNIINEIELNNPYSFGDSKYSPIALNNLSWLKSEGQYNSKAVYPAYYDWALTNFNNGVEGFALSTGEYTDYDVVINPADETFRLPLLDGSEDLTSEKFDNLTLLSSGSTYTAPANGWYYLCKTGNTNQYMKAFCNNKGYSVYTCCPNFNGASPDILIPCEKGDVISISYDVSGATQSFKFIYAQGNGSLYFYVGETVQNANLINAGRIEEKLADCITRNDCKAYITETYQNDTSWYRVWSPDSTGKRWCEQGGRITVKSDSQGTITLLKSFRDILYSVFMTNISTIKTTNETKAGPIWVNTQAVNSFTYTNDTWEGEMVWEAKGYIA